MEKQSQAAEPWDLVVVGGGSAGLVASKAAAGFGARVLLVESGRLGGDCLWTGCVPSKTLISSAAGGRTGQEAFAHAHASVQRAIGTIAPTDSAEALQEAGVAVMKGHARFTSRRTMDVDGVEVAFQQAVITTGTSPVVPDLEGAESVHIHTTEDFWEITELPARMVVLGGGTVGSELGHAMARLGSAVTIVQRSSRILPKEEPEASAIVQAAMVRDGVDVRTGRTAVYVRQGEESAGVLTLDDGSEVPFDVLLAALGRSADTDALDLSRAGVRTDAKGFVLVDAAAQTTNPRIWAAGDVTGPPMFTHTAGMDGSVAGSNAILGLRRKTQRAVVPRATFTSPEVAAVGLQAADADPEKHRVVTWHHEHADRAIAENAMDGYSRIVVDKSGRILGGTIVSPRAGETIGEVSLAVKQKLNTGDIAGTIHPYPTYTDAFWNAAVVDVKNRLNGGGISFAVQTLRGARRQMLRMNDWVSGGFGRR
ncbi:FAD-dependent oxidoreductase [Microbacterium sp. NPDC076768]|uniref:dihydrolipoyl dehydrogenase family protein n=1 Tax=Microbacterium sp. NPDC076768 TaxID=3154858 RepID=UPI0034232EA5